MASKKKKQQEQQKKKERVLLVIAACAIACILLGTVISLVLERRQKQPVTSNSTAESAANAGADSVKLAMSADEINTTHYADISIQDYGTVTVALDETAAPATVQNFIKLAEEGFYDGLTFHRIIDGFMMQGGDPNGNGTGGSDQTIKGEFSENGFDNPISHTRGAISMARSNNLNSASSQFFIVQQDSTFLDGQYAAFGFVTEGMDIVDRICEEAQPTDNNGSIAKDRQPVIESIVIRANGESAGAAK
jgi:peptidyl-prolyl cis-trans isomerase B (cyclophilin B)